MAYSSEKGGGKDHVGAVYLGFALNECEWVLDVVILRQECAHRGRCCF